MSTNIGSGDEARRVSALTGMLTEALKAAELMAQVASEGSSGTPSRQLFEDASKAIRQLREGEAMSALHRASVPPSLLGG